MKKYAAKWFRVATEGATTDGRTIARNWIAQMAKNYNPATYGARINMEHIRGILPDGPFKAYGDVLALEARDVEGGKLGLFAQLSPTDDLVTLSKARQKVYTSVEIDPNFAKSGGAYLVGLAVTDSPASLGTDMLEFSARQGDKSPLAARKHSPHNLFAEAIELDGFTFEPEDDKPSLLAPVLEKLNALIGKHKGADKQFANVADTLAAVADHLATVDEQMGELTRLNERVAKLETDLNTERQNHATTRTEFTALRDQLDKEPAGSKRPPANGGSGSVKTDC